MKENDLYQQDFLSFKVADNTVLLNTDFVQEVIEPVQASPLPFVPSYVDGLVNVSDKIIPQINLTEYFSFTKSSSDIQTLVIVEVKGDRFALLANEILSSLTLVEEEVSSIELVEDGLLSLIQLSSGQKLFLFDAEQLLTVMSKKDSSDVLDDQEQEGFLGEFSAVDVAEDNEKEFLIVAAGETRYAFLLSEVLEVVDVNHISPLARAPDCVAGIGLVRDVPYLLVFLDYLLDAENSEAVHFSQASVLIVEYKKKYFGLVVSEVEGLLKISDDDIRYDEKGKIKSFSVGDRLTEVVNFKKILTKELVKTLAHCMPSSKVYEQTYVQETDVLYFSDKKQYFGFCLDNIKRIVYGKSIEPLLEPNPYLLGTMEFDGEVIPVVDLLSFLDIKRKKKLHNEYIVVRIDNKYWAFAIHKSRSIISVEQSSIDWLSSSQSHVQGFCTYENRLMTLINPISICQHITADTRANI